MSEIKKAFEDAIEKSLALIEAGKAGEALVILEELMGCFELENNIVMLHDYASKQAEHQEETSEENLDEDSVEARLRKLNPEFKLKKGSRKPKRRSFRKLLTDFLEKTED